MKRKVKSRKLNENQQKVFDIFKDNYPDWMNTTDLASAVKDSARMVKNYCRQLEERGMLEKKYVSGMIGNPHAIGINRMRKQKMVVFKLKKEFTNG